MDTASETPAPLSAGDRAPDVSLPLVNGDGVVALGDYRGKTAVLLVLFRGLHCPFCRQQIAQLGLAVDRLRQSGVEPLGVIDTRLDRAALYLRHRPTRVPLVSDPERSAHRAFGLPAIRTRMTGSDGHEVEVAGEQVVGHFLIDREGIVRWRHVEGSDTAGRFPGAAELLAAARASLS